MIRAELKEGESLKSAAIRSGGRAEKSAQTARMSIHPVQKDGFMPRRRS